MNFKAGEKSFSLYDALNSKYGERFNPQLQRKATLKVLSHALEEAVMAHDLKPVIFTAFQQNAYYAREASRYEILNRRARMVVVYGCEVPEAPEALEHDWFIIVNEPRFKAMMISRELEDGSFESEANRPFLSVWIYDAEVVDYACQLLARRFTGQNSRLSLALDEVLALPHEPLEQVRFSQEVGNRILHELERTNLRAISQIKRNQQLLSNLERQGEALEEASHAAEVAFSERTTLQGELKKLYDELTRSQQIMTDTLIAKTQVEQRNGLCVALLQQLEAEIGLMQTGTEASEVPARRAKDIIRQLQKILLHN